MPKSKSYDEFVDKFKPRHTTDDCMTPPAVYAAVADWVAQEYGLDRGDFVRPFYPGGDYQAYDYPDGCVVMDNPPFSILAKICSWYQERGIRFFLFAPGVSLFSAPIPDMTSIVADLHIIYDNGADVPTGFKTNIEPGTAIRVSGSLHDAVRPAIDAIAATQRATVPAYDYPPNVCTPARLQKIDRRGINWSCPENECFFTRALDAQREKGKSIFGGGYLLSEKAAAREVITWELSDREKAIIAGLGEKAE
jgi:hypothetical protein